MSTADTFKDCSSIVQCTRYGSLGMIRRRCRRMWSGSLVKGAKPARACFLCVLERYYSTGYYSTIIDKVRRGLLTNDID